MIKINAAVAFIEQTFHALATTTAASVTNVHAQEIDSHSSKNNVGLQHMTLAMGKLISLEAVWRL